MKIKLNSVFVCFYLSLILLSCTAYAAWPEFFPPDKELLLGLLTQSQCPSGQAKLASTVSVNIRQYLCKTFCPASWTWVTNSDEQCHDLADFNFKEYEITYYRDEDGTVDYSLIKALYGSIVNPTLFLIATPPGEHWYCYEINPDMHLISCANDI